MLEIDKATGLILAGANEKAPRSSEGRYRRERRGGGREREPPPDG